MSRSFLDNSGLLHQKIADIATNVDIVIAGLPLKLKSSS
jgi:adenosyl cobinamide kinase/adenosyl cobinamide phosphate guanylyltransferase